MTEGEWEDPPATRRLGQDRGRAVGGCEGNGATYPGAAAAAATTTTTGTLGVIERSETMEEEGGGAAATATEKSEVCTRG